MNITRSLKNALRPLRDIIFSILLFYMTSGAFTDLVAGELA
jgi:hypothetical protein